jgi:capsular polysaccharide biosynthesis protein
MPSSSTTAEDSEDIDLLDILTVIAEHLKLLVLGPLFIGFTALLLSLSLPKSYESISLLDVEKPGLSISPSTIVSLSNSADSLDRIALDLGIAKDQSKAARLKKISRLVSASVGRQDKLVTLRTFGSTPEQAQKLNTAVWQHLLPLTLPRGGEMRRLQTLLKIEQARLDDGNRLEQSITQQLQKGNITDQQARLYGELLDSNGSRMRAISALQAQMEGLTVADLVQTPTLPEEAIKPKPALIAIIATLASGMLLLLFVFAHHAMRSSCQRPEQAAKIARLRAAFGRSDRKSCA